MILRYAILGCLLLLAGLAPGYVCGAEPTLAGWVSDPHLTGVVPEPQQIFLPRETRPSWRFPDETVIYVSHPEDRVGAEELAEQLHTRFGKTSRIVSDNLQTAHVVFVRHGSDLASAFPDGTKVTKLEGYRLLVDDDRVVVEGADARGVLYGAMTLSQLIDANASVKPIFVRDWPEMQQRLSYAGLIKPEELREHVRRCARAKINAVILESPWNGHTNFWFSPTPENRKCAAEFFELCRKYHIDPIPLVQGPGWGYGVTDLEPMATEAEWYEDEAVTLYTAKPTALSQRNVVTTEAAPIIVRSADGKRYVEWRDYTVIRGQTGRPYAVDNEPWRLQAVAGGQIADGSEVLVSYNAAKPDVHKAYCPSEPRSYEILDRAIDYVMETYRPKMIHIGHDEVWQAGSCSRCIESGQSVDRLLFNDILHRYNRIREHNPETEILMWYDPIRTTNEQHLGKVLPLVDELPKDIIICPWIYHTGDVFPDRMRREVAFELEHGFRVIGTAAGYFMSNNLDWYNALNSQLSPSGNVLGMMFSYWGDGRLQQSVLPESANLMWNGDAVDRELFRTLDEVTKNLKSMGLMLTFSLRDQMKPIVAWYHQQVEEGKTPSQIQTVVEKRLRLDRSVYTQAYGHERWGRLIEAPFPEQEAGMVQRFAELFRLMGRYRELERAGEKSVATRCEAAREVVAGLHRIGFLSHAERDELNARLTHRILPAQDVFGQSLTAPGEKLEVGSDNLSQLEVVTELDGFVPDEAEYRIYFVGNSITRHYFNEKTIANLGWDHIAGMAASHEKNDYAHQLAAKIQDTMPERTVRVFFGRGGNPVRGLEGIDQARQFKPHLVIVQLGEHVKVDHSNSRIHDEYDALLKALQSLVPAPRIIAAGLWSPRNRQPYGGRVALIDSIQRSVADSRDVPYVSVEKYASDPACHGTGSSFGVRWHPNDKGHAGYAREIFQAFMRMYEKP